MWWFVLHGFQALVRPEKGSLRVAVLFSRCRVCFFDLRAHLKVGGEIISQEYREGPGGRLAGLGGVEMARGEPAVSLKVPGPPGLPPGLGTWNSNKPR